MKHSLFLAWRSVIWNRGRSALIVLSLAITIWLPVTVRLVLNQFRQEITARSVSTPLIVGARGSRIDLTLHALYFETSPPANTTIAESESITQSSLGVAIPLHIRYRTQSQPGVDGAIIVGTSPEYFEFRGLSLQAGESLSMLGECVIGSRVAERMNLAVGDSILSAPRNAFDLAGDYPLKMTVVGILNTAHSPDDDAVFIDIRTAWVIDGIGHGHQDVNSSTDPNLLLNSNNPAAITANAGVLPFTEITEENIDSFHFHGDPESFPLTAAIVVPSDEKSRVMILGRYASAESESQCLKPPDVVEELLSLVFRVEQIVWFCSVAAFVVTALLLTLVLTLSARLRAAEMLTMFRLGCSRLTIGWMQISELLLLLIAASSLSLVASWLTLTLARDSLRQLLF